MTAIVFRAMQALTNAIWGSETTPHSTLTVFGTIMRGGALIALLRWVETRLAGGAPPSPESFGEQLEAPATLPVDHLRRALMDGLAATLAVAFGGAVGPEAGLVAVATELSALVAALLARDADERRLIGAAGAAGALGGFYASPPAGAFLAESAGPEDRLPRALVFLASVAGLAGFVLVLEMLPGGEGHLVVALPDYTPSRTASELLAVVPSVGRGAGRPRLRHHPAEAQGGASRRWAAPSCRPWPGRWPSPRWRRFGPNCGSRGITRSARCLSGVRRQGPDRWPCSQG
ncbi:chloride channel protein [Paracoccus sanguinis]|uniref:chloride channel protein n=1 Tax=Paracoccus sanguinis TaxID=1545044 RepID=UPI000A66F7DF|nr:chloride channel protein [Paracoccus sanguinis]